jgi:hypothetical protein
MTVNQSTINAIVSCAVRRNVKPEHGYQGELHRAIVDTLYPNHPGPWQIVQLDPDLVKIVKIAFLKNTVNQRRFKHFVEIGNDNEPWFERVPQTLDDADFTICIPNMPRSVGGGLIVNGSYNSSKNASATECLELIEIMRMCVAAHDRAVESKGKSILGEAFDKDNYQPEPDGFLS